MPTKKKQESQEEQSERFRQAVRDLMAAGELSHTDADKAMESLLRGQAARKDGD